jgi:hypothetical protein
MSDYLTINRIEFLVTYRCNAHCAHVSAEIVARNVGCLIEPDPRGCDHVCDACGALRKALSGVTR